MAAADVLAPPRGAEDGPGGQAVDPAVASGVSGHRQNEPGTSPKTDGPSRLDRRGVKRDNCGTYHALQAGSAARVVRSLR